MSGASMEFRCEMTRLDPQNQSQERVEATYTATESHERRRKRRRRRLSSISNAVVGSFAVWISSSFFQGVSAAASVPVSVGFEFNGKHSDFAQQYYVRYQALDSVDQIEGLTSASLPEELLSELDQHALEWEDLPGLLQRALLWDAGYAIAQGSNQLVKLYTRCGRTMAEIFVPKKAYERTGCTPRECVLPNGESFYRHKYCDGDQMATASLCAAESDDSPPTHSGMWGDGGEIDTIPEVTLMRHAWTDHSNSYLMFALHTTADEVAYEKCPTTPAMVIPCVSYATSDKSKWCRPERGPIVQPWLTKYAEDHQEDRTWLLVPLTIAVFAALAAVTVYRYKAAMRERDRKYSDDEYSQESLFDSGSVEAFLMSSRHGRKAAIDDDEDDENEDEESSKEQPQRQQQLREGALNAAAFEYFNSAIGLSASAFDPLSSVQRVHPLRGRITTLHKGVTASFRRNEIAIRSFRLFEAHRRIRQLRVPMRDIQYLRVLAQGNTGEVWLAMHQAKQVAVKQLVPSKRRVLHEMEMFMAEIYLMAQLKHPNIISLIGIAWTTLEHVVMIQELMEKGDLQKFLAAQKLLSQPEKSFTWNKHRLQIAVSVANALSYMHALTPKLLHRDVKSRNVLLSAQMDVKLCDFGISRRKYNAEEEETNLTVTAAAGTMSWTAPELLLGEEYSEKVDIYSYGILLGEIDTCTLPYHDPESLADRVVHHPLRLMKLIVNEGFRPKLSSDCPPRIAELIEACLQRDAMKRPSAREICAWLNRGSSNSL